MRGQRRGRPPAYAGFEVSEGSRARRARASVGCVVHAVSLGLNVGLAAAALRGLA